MATKTKTARKSFDAVAFMRKQRDRISQDIADMDFNQIKEYFSKKRRVKKRPATNNKPSRRKAPK